MRGIRPWTLGVALGWSSFACGESKPASDEADVAATNARPDATPGESHGAPPSASAVATPPASSSLGDATGLEPPVAPGEDDTVPGPAAPTSSAPMGPTADGPTVPASAEPDGSLGEAEAPPEEPEVVTPSATAPGPTAPEPDAADAGVKGAPSAVATDAGQGSFQGDLDAFRLAVVGSSTAAGEGASAGNGWVSLLDDAVAARVTTSFEVNNLARGGYTSSELMPGSGADGNIDDAIALGPNLIIVALAGSNDLSSGTSTSEFLARMAELRGAGEARGIPVFFVSTAPKDLSESERQTLRDWAGAMGEAFESCWVPESALPYAPCFIDIFEALASASLGVASEVSAGDGIHLNDLGHERIFQAALPVVEAYVCRMTACQ